MDIVSNSIVALERKPARNTSPLKYHISKLHSDRTKVTFATVRHLGTFNPHSQLEPSLKCRFFYFKKR